MLLRAGRRSYRLRGIAVLNGANNARADFLNRQIGIHRNQPSLTLLVIPHGPGLFLVSGQTFADHFLAIVVTSDQLRPVKITHFIDAGWLGVDVIDPSTGWAGTPSGDPGLQKIIVHVHKDHNRQALAMGVVKELMLEKSVEPTGLGRGARKTIEHKTAIAISLPQPGSDHVANQVVRHQLTAGHNGLGLLTQLRASSHVVTQNVSSGDLWDTVTLGNSFCLGAFTRARWPDQDQRPDIARSVLGHLLALPPGSHAPPLLLLVSCSLQSTH